MNLPVFVWFIFAMFFPFLFTAFAISFIAYTVDKSFSCMGVDKLIVKVYISSASHYCFQFHFHHHHLFKEL